LGYVIHQFLNTQTDTGRWPRSHPLFLYPKLGNAYCYDYELLTDLLYDVQLRQILQRRIKTLARSALALEATKIPLTDTAVKASGADPQPVGWSSGHLKQEEVTSPESWSTASVFHFCHRLHRLVVESIRRQIFEYTVSIYAVPSAEPRIDPKEFLDSRVPVPESRGQKSLTRVLEHDFLRPLFDVSDDVRRGLAIPKSVPTSAILYGPPGTAKTELADIISRFLGWPLLKLDPSHLTRHGLDQLHAETNTLFRMLEAAEEMVVLFDEFDELVREREVSGTESASRFLTTAMLPKLTALSARRRVVYLLATNHLERFDSAIRRPGRFDIIIPVMPPTLAEKIRKWPKVGAQLRRLRVGTSTLADRNIRQTLAGLTFAEFRDVEAKLSQSRHRSEFEKLVSSAKSSATMFQPIAEPDTSGDGTWEERLASQTSKIRLP
jgi:ATPase family associated with various cellular activities (AAA)